MSEQTKKEQCAHQRVLGAKGESATTAGVVTSRCSATSRRTLDEDELRLGHAGGGVGGQTGVIAGVGGAERVDGQQTGEGVDEQRPDTADAVDGRPTVDEPAEPQRRVALGDGARQRQPLAQTQRRIHLERCDLGRHCPPPRPSTVHFLAHRLGKKPSRFLTKIYGVIAQKVELNHSDANQLQV